jgi:hypothetical protein
VGFAAGVAVVLCGFPAVERVPARMAVGLSWSTIPGMSYAIVWRENGRRPVLVGKLVVGFDRLVLEGAVGGVAVWRELVFGGIRSIRVGRARDERLGGRPVAVVECGGDTFTIASLAGGGELNEIVGLVTGAVGGMAADALAGCCLR